MNKSELIEKIAEEAGVTRAAAGHTPVSYTHLTLPTSDLV